jgi:YfiH family protein
MAVESAPAPGPGFRWRPSTLGVTLVADVLEEFQHGWTTRSLGLGGSDDTGWEQVADAAGVPVADLVRLRQVHGLRVYHAESPAPGSLPEADIVVSGNPRVAVTVQAADCVPLLLADGTTGTVAAAHAGWRGTAAGVAGAAVRALSGSGPVTDAVTHVTGPDPRTVAAVGPSIGPCCYRVGEDVRRAFLARWPHEAAAWFIERDGGLFLDLWAANRDQLVAAGVDRAHVFVSGLCTACHPAWFHSYRRDGPGTGRLAGYIRAHARS